jgi:hypothetical protein
VRGQIFVPRSTDRVTLEYNGKNKGNATCNNKSYVDHNNGTEHGTSKNTKVEKQYGGFGGDKGQNV